MIIFYKNVPYFYESENNRRIEIMGKDVVVEQGCIKCEAIIARKGAGRKARYRIMSPQQYILTSDYCDVSYISPHYHIQFVDNSLHTLTRVCIPLFKAPFGGGHSLYIHTIADIIEYLAQIYNIKEKGKIYALAIEENSSTWRILTHDDKTRTIKYFNKKEKKSSVVFYYIKEGIKDKSLIPCVFKGPDSEQKDKQLISLFLSRFMECAMEQLGPYTREQKYDSAEKPKLVLEETYKEIHVYEYTNPANDKTIYNQAQLYYSDFYVDEKIKEHTELCPMLSTSIEELKKPNEMSNKKVKQYKFTWYVRTPSNPQEYTHYYFIIKNSSKKYLCQTSVETLLIKLKEKSLTRNNPVYAFYIAENQEKLWNIFFFQQQNKKIDKKYSSIIVPDISYPLLAFRTFNSKKPNLSIHNEIFSVFLDNPTSTSDKKVSA